MYVNTLPHTHVRNKSIIRWLLINLWWKLFEIHNNAYERKKEEEERLSINQIIFDDLLTYLVSLKQKKQNKNT